MNHVIYHIPKDKPEYCYPFYIFVQTEEILSEDSLSCKTEWNIFYEFPRANIGLEKMRYEVSFSMFQMIKQRIESKEFTNRTDIKYLTDKLFDSGFFPSTRYYLVKRNTGGSSLLNSMILKTELPKRIKYFYENQISEKSIQQWEFFPMEIFNFGRLDAWFKEEIPKKLVSNSYHFPKI